MEYNVFYAHEKLIIAMWGPWGIQLDKDMDEDMS